MPPTKNWRTASWKAAAALRYLGFSVTRCASHRAHGWVDEAMTRAPWVRAASMTAARVSRRLCVISATDRQTLELVSICVRRSSFTTRCGTARARACSKREGSGSETTSRVAASTIINSSSIPRVISIAGLPIPSRRRDVFNWLKVRTPFVNPPRTRLRGRGEK